MKTITKFLMVCCCLVSQAIAIPADDEAKIRAQFQRVLWAVDDLDATAYVESMHPHALKLWADHVSRKEERCGRTVGADAAAAPAAYATRMLAEAFRTSPKTFAFPVIDTVRIHGMLMDGETAFVVYSTVAEEEDGFRQHATMTFRQDQGTWKQAGLSLCHLVAKTWPENAKQGDVPKL